MTDGAAPHDDEVTVRVSEDDASWDSLESAWSGLFDASPYASTPLRFDWLRLWWTFYGRHYGRKGKGLKLITVWNGPRLAGVLPLYESLSGQVRTLRFISTGEQQAEETCPDYMNFLCLPDHEGVTLAACWRTLRAARWDHLDLIDVAENSPLLTARDRLTGAGRVQVRPRGACPVARLNDGFEAYLAGLSRNTRKVAHRLLRFATESGAVLEFADADSVDSFFDDLVRLHQERWVAQGEPGCFAAPRFCAFHRALARTWVPAGTAVLARVSVDGTAVAVVYGFKVGSKFDSYQAGMTTATVGALSSPGLFAHLLLIRELATRGFTEYDFLGGSSFYKERLATDTRPLYRLQVWRPTLRSGAVRIAGTLGKAARKTGRVARKARRSGGQPTP